MWRETMAQRPPGDLFASPPRPPPTAPVDPDLDYPEEWGPFDDVPPGVLHVPDAFRASPPRTPPTAPVAPDLDYPEEWGPAADAAEDWQPDAPCEYEERDILAALRQAPRHPARPRFSRRDPRHSGPRLLRAGDTEICRQFNRGGCGDECAHGRAHVCSQCGVAGHAAKWCSTPESAWPAKQ